MSISFFFFISCKQFDDVFTFGVRNGNSLSKKSLERMNYKEFAIKPIFKLYTEKI